MESQYHMNGSKTHQRKALDLMAMEIHWGSMDMLVIILFGMLVVTARFMPKVIIIQ